MTTPIKNILVESVACLRVTGGIEATDIYQKGPELAFFSDEKGYAELANIFKNHANDDSVKIVQTMMNTIYGLSFVLMKPVATCNKDFIWLCERPVKFEGKKRMQFVIFASSKAYSYLAELCKTPESGRRLTHFDDFVFPGSCSLNFKEPIMTQDSDSLIEWKSVALCEEHYFPSNLTYMPDEILDDLSEIDELTNNFYYYKSCFSWIEK